MERLIFVGGLQYSGKTTLCRKLESYGKKRYKHIQLDESFDYLAFHRDEFLELVQRFDPEIYAEIRKLGENIRGVNNAIDADDLTIFANYMYLEGRLDEFDKLQRLCSLIHVGDLLRQTGHYSHPLLDGTMPDRNSRKILYTSLKMALGSGLDDLNKSFVFFNLGLERSLERYRTSQRQQWKSMVHTEDAIRETYASQEIPTVGEMPNTDVLIINDENDLDVERLTGQKLK